MKKLWIGLGLTSVLIIAGCGGSDTEKKTESSSASTPAAGAGGTATPDEANGATISGKVTLDGAKPTMKALDMSANPYCMRAHPTAQQSQEVEVGPNGGLKDAFVWIKEGDAVTGKTWAVPTSAVTLEQTGCMYKPHVLGVMAGQNIDIKTSDQTNHNIHPMPQANQEWNESQPPGDPGKTKSFARQEVMIPVKCQIHPWMKAYIGVVSHPFYFVTSDDGSYTIKGLPPGTYTVQFWQEKYGTHEEKITVAPKETKTLDYAFKAS